MIQIKTEFRNLIPPLSPDEYNQLEENIVADGCRDPLVVWRNGADWLVDGHNRLEICTSKNIDYKIAYMDFANESEAQRWIILNQFGRRNLSAFVRGELAIKLKPLFAAKAKEQQIRKPKSVSPNLVKRIDTQKEIAKVAGVSHGTVAKIEKILDSGTDEQIRDARSEKKSIHKVYQEIRDAEKKQDIKSRKTEYTEAVKKEIAVKPVLLGQNGISYLKTLSDDSVDLIITDPPYMTEYKGDSGFKNFLGRWITDVFRVVKRTGRVIIFSGAYPQEIAAYLDYFLSIKTYRGNVESGWICDAPIIWTYRNTLGQTPKMKYNLNYQVAWHLYTNDSNPLDTAVTSEMFSVQDINAPDGRIGDRYFKWQKPMELGLRLIKHTTQKGDLVVDPFAGSGTFLLAAARLGRSAIGCEIDKGTQEIAVERGCMLQ